MLHKTILILRKHLLLCFACIVLVGCNALSGKADIMPPAPTAEPNGGISQSAETNRLRLTVTKVQNLDDRLRFFLVATNGSPDARELPLDKFVVRDSGGKLYAADAENSYWMGTVPAKFSVTGYITLRDPLENITGSVDLGFTNADLFVQGILVKADAPLVVPLNIQNGRLTVTKVEILSDSLYRFWLKVDWADLSMEVENFYAKDPEGRQYSVTKFDWPSHATGPLAGYFTVGPIAKDTEYIILGFAPTPDQIEYMYRMAYGPGYELGGWINIPVPQVAPDGQPIVPVLPTSTPWPEATIETFYLAPP